jgi:Raf kinase inhibitor-like YbhB/YbcL family protein
MKWHLWVGVVFLVIGVILFLSHYKIKTIPVDSMPDASSFKLTSAAFAEGGVIPAKYTCDGDSKLSPPLSISGVPLGAGMLVLVMDDPDVPKELKPDGIFDHWVVYAIPPQTKEIPEGGIVGATGLNGAGDSAYTGPCPPPQYEPKEHRYIFTLYAVEGTLNFIKVPTKTDVLTAIQGRILAQTALTGRYARP